MKKEKRGEKISESQEASENLKKSSEEEQDESQKDKESELEEQVEQTEETIEETETSIDDSQFREFLRPSAESFSPVLEKVEAPQQESLEQDVASVSISDDSKEKNDAPSKYIQNVRENYATIEEPERREDLTLHQPARINIEAAGRDLRHQPRQVPFATTDLPEARGGEIPEGKYVEPERIDMEKVGREPQERVKKYEIR